MKFKASLHPAIKRRVLWVTACLLSLPLLSPAQQNKLTVTPPEQLTVKRGETVSQSLKIVVLPGFHVQSDKPREEYLIPLKLTWEGPLETKATVYPKPEEIKVAGTGMLVFTGNFTIRTQFKVPDGAPAGAATMIGKLHYQACNDQMCFRPATTDVRLPVLIN